MFLRASETTGNKNCEKCLFFHKASYFACDVSLDFRKVSVINISHNVVSLIFPFSFFVFARNQAQISSSANEPSKSAPEMTYATGLILGTYKNLTHDTKLFFLCIFDFSLGIIKNLKNLAVSSC